MFEHRVIAEAEAAQERAHLRLGPIGNRLEQRVDHGFLEIQSLGLVLLEVAGLHVVLPEASRPFTGLLQPHHQPQQGGFPGPIGTNKGNAVAPLHLEVGLEKQDVVVVVVREVVDQCDLTT